MSRRTISNRGFASHEMDLNTKTSPSQERARNTFESILEAAGELLGEVGIERLSTNMVCERCGITPPALYRYFPNKYAILSELSRRLMAAEDEVVLQWLAQASVESSATLEDDIRRYDDMLRNVRQAVHQQPGGKWILRVMRAVPILREIRSASLGTVTQAICDRYEVVYPEIPSGRLRVVALLSATLATAANELIIDEPGMEDELSREVARMMSLYLRDAQASYQQ